MTKVPRIHCHGCEQEVTGPGPWCPLYDIDGLTCVLEHRNDRRHPLFGHLTVFLEDDSVWCYDCGGTVAVADG